MSTPMRTLFFVVILGISAKFVLLASAYAEPIVQEKLQENALTIATKQGNQTFTVEVAITADEQQLGLMNRDKLSETGGMLFPMPVDKKVEMWMKDTLIPLDMLFIDRTGKIVYIAHETTPLSLDVIATEIPTHAVLELAGGTTERKHITEGDYVIHPYFKP